MKTLIDNLRIFSKSPNKHGSRELRAEISKIETFENLDARTLHFLQLAYEVVARPIARIHEHIENWIGSYRGVATSAKVVDKILYLELTDGTQEKFDLPVYIGFSDSTNEELQDFVILNEGRTLRWSKLSEQFNVQNLIGIDDAPFDQKKYDEQIKRLLDLDNPIPNSQDTEKEYWARGSHPDGRLLKTVHVIPMFPKILCQMDNGKIYELDMSWIWRDGNCGPMGQPLKELFFFNQVFVSPHGAVTWPNEFDIAPEYPARVGKEVRK